MSTLLQQAIELAKSGDRASAETLIRQTLEQNPNNEVAWVWLSGVSSDMLVKREALKRVLQLNPNNMLAQEGLAKFGKKRPEPESSSSNIKTADITPDQPITAAATDEISDDSLPSALEAPVFDILPGDFDLGLDDLPNFDLDIDSFEAEPVLDADETLFANDVPAIDVPPLVERPVVEEAPISDRLEQVFASTDAMDTSDALSEEAPDAIFDMPDIEPEDLTVPDQDLVNGLAPAEDDNPIEDIHDVLKKRRKRQNRMLIAAAAFFAVVVLGSCSLYYYVTEIADLYLFLPQLAQPELEETAGKPENGVSELQFHGFPAASARIQWTADSNAPTCQGGTVGLKVDFNNGDEPQLYSNRNCSENSCGFQKDLSPGPITQVTVTYLCGKDAIITLHQ